MAYGHTFLPFSTIFFVVQTTNHPPFPMSPITALSSTNLDPLDLSFLIPPLVTPHSLATIPMSSITALSSPNLASSELVSSCESSERLLKLIIIFGGKITKRNFHIYDNDLEYALHIVLNHIGVLLKGQVVAFILVTSVIV